MTLTGDPAAPAPMRDGETELEYRDWLDVYLHRAMCEQLGGQVCVYLDGVDVTEDCRAAHAAAGWVHIWRREHGRLVPVYDERRGDVRYMLRPRA
jgi:hypothetical protein